MTGCRTHANLMKKGRNVLCEEWGGCSLLHYSVHILKFPSYCRLEEGILGKYSKAEGRRRMKCVQWTGEGGEKGKVCW